MDKKFSHLQMDIFAKIEEMASDEQGTESNRLQVQTFIKAIKVLDYMCNKLCWDQDKCNTTYTPISRLLEEYFQLQ